MASGSEPEYIVFPMEYLNITQGFGVGTHRGTYAIDNAGRNTGIDNAFAPFTGIVKKIWPNGNTVWLESVTPVQYADGTVDYATVAFTHDNNVSDLRVGQVVAQGVNFYQEGTAGQATGNHIHIEIGRGRFTGSGWYQNEYGIWTINNKYIPYNAFYLSGTEIINAGGYPWVIKGEPIKMQQPSRDQVYDYFRRFLGHDPKDENEVQFYLNQDIRELYHQVLDYGVQPKQSEVEQAFKDLSPVVPINTPPYTDQTEYYTHHGANILYKDLAYGLLKLYNEKPIPPTPGAKYVPYPTPPLFIEQKGE